MSHTTVMVKVNAMIDEGISDLVVAMNNAFGVITDSSCEHDPDGEAFVSFSADNVESLVSKCKEISKCLIDAGCFYRLQLIWENDNGPYAVLALQPVKIDSVRKAFVKQVIQKQGETRWTNEAMVLVGRLRR